MCIRDRLDVDMPGFSKEDIKVELKDGYLTTVSYTHLDVYKRKVNNVVYTGVGLVGALTAVAGRISVGDLSCLLSYANQYTKPFNEISGVVTELQNEMCIRDSPYLRYPGRQQRGGRLLLV